MEKQELPDGIINIVIDYKQDVLIITNGKVLHVVKESFILDTNFEHDGRLYISYCTRDTDFVNRLIASMVHVRCDALRFSSDMYFSVSLDQKKDGGCFRVHLIESDESSIERYDFLKKVDKGTPPLPERWQKMLTDNEDDNTRRS